MTSTAADAHAAERSPVTHARGWLELRAREPDPQTLALDALLERCALEQDGARSLYARMREQGVEYGPAFRLLGRTYVGDAEAIAEILPPDVRAAGVEVGEASVLDACLQVAELLRPASSPGSPWVPVFVEQFERHRPAHLPLWSHARLREAEGPELQIDYRVTDARGARVATVHGLRVQRLPGTRATPNPRRAQPPSYTVRWQARTDAPVREPVRTDEHWLVLSAPGEPGDALCERIRATGARAQLARTEEARSESADADLHFDPARPDAMAELLVAATRGAGSAPTAVVHLLGVGTGVGAGTPPSAGALQRELESVCRTALSLAQAALGWERGAPPRLCFVTRGAQAADAGDPPTRVATAPLWGLVRSLALEHPELPIELIDWDPRTQIDSDQLWQELRRPHGEPRALREGAWRVARLVATRTPARAAVELRADASYLITGGLGGIGPQLARALVEAGARHLVLVGRRASADAHTDLRDELEARGARIQVRRCDVSRSAEVAKLLDAIEHEGPPLRGIFHLALTLDDGVVVRQNWPRFARVLKAKAYGAWNLHSLTRERTLDFFALFSSIHALLGAAGQSNYAAACAFLDALAQHRRALGVPALAIHWGPWRFEGSAAISEAARPRQGSGGFQPLDPERALASLLRGLAADLSALAVVDLDLPYWVREHPELGRGLLESLRGAPAESRCHAPAQRHERDAILAAPTPERLARLGSYLRERIAERQGLRGPAVDLARSLADHGMDSLGTLELRNRIAEDLGVFLPALELIESASAIEIAASIAQRLGRSTARPDADAEEIEDLSARLNEMSDEEVERALGRLLADGVPR